MYGDSLDVGVLVSEIFGEEDIGKFGMAVAGLGVVIGHKSAGVGERETAFGTYLVAGGTEVNDADIRVGFFSSFAQCG